MPVSSNDQRFALGASHVGIRVDDGRARAAALRLAARCCNRPSSSKCRPRRRPGIPNGDRHVEGTERSVGVEGNRKEFFSLRVDDAGAHTEVGNDFAFNPARKLRGSCPFRVDGLRRNTAGGAVRTTFPRPSRRSCCRSRRSRRSAEPDFGVRIVVLRSCAPGSTSILPKFPFSTVLPSPVSE